MNFVCDPLSIILIAGLSFVFVLLAILLGYSIIVMSGLARITRRLRALSDEVESLLLTPLELLESLIGQLKLFIEGWRKSEGGAPKGTGRKKKSGRNRSTSAKHGTRRENVKVEEAGGGEFEIKDLE